MLGTPLEAFDAHHAAVGNRSAREPMREGPVMGGVGVNRTVEVVKSVALRCAIGAVDPGEDRRDADKSSLGWKIRMVRGVVREAGLENALGTPRRAASVNAAVRDRESALRRERYTQNSARQDRTAAASTLPLPEFADRQCSEGPVLEKTVARVAALQRNIRRRERTVVFVHRRGDVKDAAPSREPAYAEKRVVAVRVDGAAAVPHEGNGVE